MEGEAPGGETGMVPLPIESGPEGIQPHTPHTGRPRLDLILAGVAVLISLISLGVGFENASSEQQMVAANSWPFLVYSTGRTDKELTLKIVNQGVGPARVKAVTIGYAGQSARGLRDLLHICCGLPKGTGDILNEPGLVRESRVIGIIPPRESLDIVVLDRTPENAQIWDKLERARLHLNLNACYCSVLGTCWTTDLAPTTDPKLVDRCPAASGYIE